MAKKSKAERKAKKKARKAEVRLTKRRRKPQNDCAKPRKRPLRQQERQRKKRRRKQRRDVRRTREQIPRVQIPSLLREAGETSCAQDRDAGPQKSDKENVHQEAGLERTDRPYAIGVSRSRRCYDSRPDAGWQPGSAQRARAQRQPGSRRADAIPFEARQHEHRDFNAR